MFSRQKLIIASCFTLLIAASLFIQPRLVPFAPEVVLAQTNTCPNIVKAALAASDKQCSRIGRNKACYGSKLASVEPQPGVTSLRFNNPGDIADTKSIRFLKLAALDTAANTWGIALMRLQADLPNTTPTDNMTLVMFGDVQMTDAAQEASAERPTQIAEYLTAQPSPAAVSTAAPTVAPNAKPYIYKPLQAFYFKSGSSDPVCAEAPHDGILIQSPQGKQKVELSVDGARIQIGSTIFLQAQASGYLTVSTLEGSATVIAFGQAQTAPALYRIRVPLDANLKASGPPLPPEFYDSGAVQALPVTSLPAAVTILPAPPTGSTVSQWQYIRAVGQRNCPVANTTFFPAAPTTASVIVSPDGKRMWLTFASGNVYALDGMPDGTYTLGTPGPITLKLTLHYVSPTHIEGQSTARITQRNGPNAGLPIPNCTSDGADTMDTFASLTAPTQAATP